MTGYDALKSHPFFDGVNWERVRQQEEPVPAFEAVYDQNDSSKVISFNLAPPLAQSPDTMGLGLDAAMSVVSFKK